MSKTIWYISKYAVTPQYGNPTRQYFLGKYLAREGNELTLIYSRSSMFGKPPRKINKPLISESEGFRQVMLPGPLVKLGFSLKRVWSWLLFEWRIRQWAKKQSKKPDVVIVSSLSILTFLTGIYFKKNFGCQLVVEVRDIYPFTLVATKKFKASNPIIKYLGKVEKKAYQKADLIVSTLDYFEQHLNNIYPAGIKKFQWIPMGIDLEYYLGDTNQNQLDIQLPKGNLFVVGYAGTFGMTQATGVIFNVIRELKNEKQIHFLLAGGGVEKDKGLKYIEGQNNYTDLGKINKDQVPNMLEKCDVVLNPWLDLEVYQYGISPNKWMDYMYAGKPIIVGFAGKSKLIKLANCGSIIKPENKEALIREIHRFRDMSIEERRQIGRRGRSYLEKHLTYKKHAQTLLNRLSD